MIKRAAPTRLGRPPKGEAALLNPIMVRFPREMLDAIDAIVAERLDQPDRSSVVRELIADALARRAERRR